MEEIIKSITEAEAEAAEIKANAQSRAALIIESAQSEAAEIAKKAETECKLLRENGLRTAERTAQDNYLNTVRESAASAENYADGVIKTAEAQVDEIVGRIVGGNR